MNRFPLVTLGGIAFPLILDVSSFPYAGIHLLSGALAFVIIILSVIIHRIIPVMRSFWKRDIGFRLMLAAWHAVLLRV